MRQNAALGSQPYLVRIVIAQARICAARGEAERARGLLDEAADVALPHGLDALAHQIESLRSESSRAGTPPRAGMASPLAHAALRCEGDYWTVAHGGQLARVRDAKGLHYLRVLLREPGREFHVLDLVCALHEDSDDHVRAAPDAAWGAAASILDGKAKRAYRDTLHALRSEADEAERLNDVGRAAALREQIDRITEQLAAAVGHGGRDRQIHSVSERARASVTKAIRTPIRLIAERHPPQAQLLDGAVSTGTFCRYEPPSEQAVKWEL
jgi:hypothetical protein